MTDIVFKCPKCGGSQYAVKEHPVGCFPGSQGETEGMRYCVTPGANVCDFRWHVTDDWQYFVAVLTFKNEAEYQVAMRVNQGFKMLKMLRGKS